jgi:hypothetical protein
LSGTESAASAGSGTNSSAISFPACTAGTSTVVGFATFDASATCWNSALVRWRSRLALRRPLRLAHLFRP